jgi:hypothetical protein
VYGTKVSKSDKNDPVLGYPILHPMQSQKVILGLPTILPKYLYIIPVSVDISATSRSNNQMLKLGGSDDSDLLWIEKSLKWL